jgi:hypothetical protein
MTRYRLPSLLALLLAAAAGYAHHSRPAHFDLDASVAVEGVVGDFLWRNPHIFIYLEVENEAGELEAWELEMQNTASMTNRGWTEDTIKIDDYIKVTGNPHRTSPRYMFVTTIEREADGFVYDDEYAYR